MAGKRSGRSSVRVALVAAFTAAILAGPASAWFGYQLARVEEGRTPDLPALTEAVSAREHAESFRAQLSEYARADLAAIPAYARAHVRARIMRARSTFELFHALADSAYTRGDYRTARVGYENAVRSAHGKLRRS